MHYQWLHDALADDTTVITSSRRLARELKAEFDQRQVADGRLAWPSAPIHFWQDWLQDSLDELTAGPDRQLIDTPSTVLLWEQCLGRAAREELLSTTSLVRHARRAWQRIHEWQVPLEQLETAAASRDEHWFARAAAKYQQRLDAAARLDSSQLVTHCARLVTDGRMLSGARILYAGFDQLSPAFSEFFESLRQQGGVAVAAPQAQYDASCQLRAYADAAQMWRAAGHWAREILQRGPDARVAIVAPDLDAAAEDIARKVREGFAPGWQLAGARFRAAVDVSYGTPLLAYPAIAVAGLCLRFASDGLSSTDVSVLLRSPFLGDGAMSERSRLDLRLRALPDRHWQPAMLLAALPLRGDPEQGERFRSALQAIAALHQQRNNQRSPADWAQSVDELLTDVGWPGSGHADSAEFQLQNRWRELLNEVARLSGVQARMSLAECVRRLLQIAGETVYQPELQGGGLRLLGMLEAAGLEFDYLWLGGMDASRWPAASNPLALVNRRLQRELGMPDASPADTLRFSQRTLARLQAAARHVEICWARLEDDKELIPSPLLDVEQQALLLDDGDPSWYARTLLGASTIDIPADKAPQVQKGEKISGGAYTVQAMREEPFAAFAKGRLHVRELDTLQPGLTAKQRGTIVHGALHQLFRELPTQEAIQAWDSANRAERIDQAAWRPLAKHWQHADPVLQRLLLLEKRRLQQLLAAFLDKECERDRFAVEGVERDATLSYGPVQLDLRIDRVDRLDDGSVLIIDYKSGAPRAFMDSLRKAPAHLQLCVYARALDESIGGLTLTFVGSREIKYVGDGGSIAWGKTDADGWAEQLEDWCMEVDVLLKRFADGDIGINTLQKKESARALSILSRFAELSHVN